MPRISDYLRRNLSCHRHHRRRSLDDHPDWPSPPDPPTGTPKNGRRTARRRDVDVSEDQQLPTPPDTQERDAEGVNEPGTWRSREKSPATPTPGEAFVMDEQIALTGIAQTPASPTSNRPRLQIETNDDLSQVFSQDPPTPATAAISSTNPTVTPPPASPTNMDGNTNPFQRSEFRRDSPATTILVPATDLNPPTPSVADYHRHTMAHRHDSTPALTDDETEHTETQRLRIQRARMTESLNESTALVTRLRTRNTIQNLDLLRERAVAAAATEARLVAAAERDRDVVEARADAERKEERKEGVVWRLRVLVWVLVLMGVVYGWWCWVNAPGFRYVRRMEERRYGL